MGAWSACSDPRKGQGARVGEAERLTWWRGSRATCSRAGESLRRVQAQAIFVPRDLAFLLATLRIVRRPSVGIERMKDLLQVFAGVARGVQFLHIHDEALVIVPSEDRG